MVSKAFVVAHGARRPQFGTTWVPPGRSVHFYAEYDHNLATSLEPAILTSGDAVPTTIYPAGSDLPNYVLTARDDDDFAEQLASVSSRLRGRLYLVGVSPLELPDGQNRHIRLCTGGFRCSKQGHDATCQGLFNQLGEAEVHVLACRGTRADASLTTSLDTGPRGVRGDEFTVLMDDFQFDVMIDAQQDPYDAFERVQALPQATLASLMRLRIVKTWLRLMQSSLAWHASPSEIAQGVDLLCRMRDELADEPAAVEMVLLALPSTTRHVLRQGMELRRHGREGPDSPRPKRPACTTFAKCWRDPESRMAFQGWLGASGASTTTTGLMRVYRLVQDLSRQISNDYANTSKVLRELAAGIGDGYLGPVPIDPRYAREAEDKLAVAHERTMSSSQDWDEDESMRRIFGDSVRELIESIERDIESQIQPMYEKYLRQF